MSDSITDSALVSLHSSLIDLASAERKRRQSAADLIREQWFSDEGEILWPADLWCRLQGVAPLDGAGLMRRWIKLLVEEQRQQWGLFYDDTDITNAIKIDPDEFKSSGNRNWVLTTAVSWFGPEVPECLPQYESLLHTVIGSEEGVSFCGLQWLGARIIGCMGEQGLPAFGKLFDLYCEDDEEVIENALLSQLKLKPALLSELPLQSHDSAQVVSAVKLLGLYGDVSAVQRLLPMLKHEDEDVRREVGMALLRLDPDSSEVNSAIREVSVPSKPVAVGFVMYERDGKPLSHWIQELVALDAGRREKATEMIWAMNVGNYDAGDDADFPIETGEDLGWSKAIENVFKQDDFPASEVCRALMGIVSKMDRNNLNNIMYYASVDQVIEHIGSKAEVIIPDMIAEIQKRSDWEVNSLIKAVAKAGAPGLSATELFFERLLKDFGHEYPDCCGEALAEQAAYDPKITERCCDLLLNEGDEMRAAVYVLTRIKPLPKAAVSALIAIYPTAGESKAMVISALASSADDVDAHNLLMEAAHDADSWTRRATAEVFKATSSSEMIDLLLSMLLDPKLNVRSTAAEALSGCASLPESALPKLLDAMRQSLDEDPDEVWEDDYHDWDFNTSEHLAKCLLKFTHLPEEVGEMAIRVMDRKEEDAYEIGEEIELLTRIGDAGKQYLPRLRRSLARCRRDDPFLEEAESQRLATVVDQIKNRL